MRMLTYIEYKVKLPFFDKIQKDGNSNARTSSMEFLPEEISEYKEPNIPIRKTSPFKTKTDRKKIADDLILDIAGTNDMVATQDKYFKRRLKYKGVKVLTIKHKDYVSV